MVICDLKKELQPITKDYLRDQGYEIITLDFRMPSTGNRWNILHPVLEALKRKDIAEAVQYADDIAHTLSFDPSKRTESIWVNGKRLLISALILIVAADAPDGHKHMGSVCNLLSYYGQDGGVKLDTYIDSLADDHPAKMSAQKYRLAKDKVRDGFLVDTAVTLSLFDSDPAVIWLGADQDHDLAMAGYRKTAVFLIIPDERTNRNVLASLYIQQSYAALVDLANQYKGRLPLRVNYLLDEFGNIPAIADFTTKITTAGGRGIRFTLAVQGIDQLAENYPHKENTIMGQCWTWIYVLTSDNNTAKLISDKCGRYTVATESYNSSAQISGSRSEGVTQGLTSRPLVMPDEVSRWPVDSVLVLRTRLQPARLPLPDISQLPIIAKDLDLDRTGEPDPEKIIHLPEPWLPNVNANATAASLGNRNQDDERSLGDLLGF
jgi:type IV secretion system protein VirD4